MFTERGPQEEGGFQNSRNLRFGGKESGTRKCARSGSFLFASAPSGLVLAVGIGWVGTAEQSSTGSPSSYSLRVVAVSRRVAVDVRTRVRT